MASLDVEYCYQRYGPMVLRRCRSMLGDEEQAVDAMQEVFVQLLVKHDQLDDRALSSLLYQITTRLCLNRLRKERRRPEHYLVHDPPSDPNSPYDEHSSLLSRIASCDDPESRSLARTFLDRIFRREKPSTRDIAVMHLLDGMTLEEVAREVGLSVSGVRKRLRTLRAHVYELEQV